MYNTVNSEGFTNAAACPSSHPVRVPQVTFETVWDTSKFNSMWKSGDPSPFLWSFEGNSFGSHADYMFGWKGDALQRAMDKSECFYDGCGSIKKQAMSVANQCSIKDMVKEDTLGCKSWILYSTVVTMNRRTNHHRALGDSRPGEHGPLSNVCRIGALISYWLLPVVSISD